MTEPATIYLLQTSLYWPSSRW